MYTSADSIPKEVTRLMAQHFHRNKPAWWRKYSFLFLAFCWIAGLLSGASVYLAAGDSLNSLMRSAVMRRSDPKSAPQFSFRYMGNA